MELNIERYHHGGDIWTAAEQLGVPSGELLDFSANINPLGPPDSVWEALKSHLPEITRYPDSQARPFRQAIAKSLGVDDKQVVAGNGAAEVLYGILRALKPQKVGLLQPCFSEYAEAAHVIHAEIVNVFAREAFDFLPELSELLEACRQVELFVIGHPNNPNGRLLPLEWLCEMACVLKKHGGHLLVDEAFLDFVPHAPTLLTEFDQWENVILLRSMTKFYAIPGLRLGYGLAQEELATRIKRELPPWGVNNLAQAAGVAALLDHEFAHRSVEWLREERPFITDRLQSLPQIQVYRGEVNFVLFYSWFPDLQAVLGRRGILIRSCAAYPGLGHGFYRVAVRSRQENLLLLGQLSAVLEGAKR